MNGDWEVKGNERTTHVRDVAIVFEWYFSTEKWCKHVFRGSDKAADTHANWLMDNGDSGHGARWKRRDYSEKLQAAKHEVLSFDGVRRSNGDRAAAWTKYAWRI